MSLPQLFRDMGLRRLRILVAEEAKPIDEDALAERLLVLIDRRRETSQLASHALAPETPDSANANKDLADAA